jgi:hypothetical protein
MPERGLARSCQPLHQSSVVCLGPSLCIHGSKHGLASQLRLFLGFEIGDTEVLAKTKTVRLVIVAGPKTG